VTTLSLTPATVGQLGGPAEWGSLDLLGDLRIGGGTPWFDVTHPLFGASPSASAAVNAAAIQAAWDALPASGGTLFIPPGTLSHAPLSLSGKNDVTIVFAGGAWLAPTSGIALTFTGCHRLTFVQPRFTIESGSTATGCIKLDGCQHATILDPNVKGSVAIPANHDCIVVTNDSYWAEVIRPRLRANFGTFRRGVAITDASNASKVIGGDIHDASDGVYVEDSNGVDVGHVALEGSVSTGNGVTLAGTGNGGAHVHHLRGENLNRLVNISQTETTNFQPPIVIGPFATISSVTTEVHNPNGVPYTYISGTKIKLDSPDQSAAQDVQFEAKASANQSASEGLFRAKAANGTTVWEVMADGSMLFTADCKIYREGADTLRTPDRFRFDTFVDVNFGQADASKLILGWDGSIQKAAILFGGDADIGRIAANRVGTNTNFHVGGEIEIDGNINHDGGGAGFFGATPVVQPNVAGSRGGNAALASLLTALVALGLVSDSTSA
jgi:hypothetical protein